MSGSFWDFAHTFAGAGDKTIPVPRGTGLILNRVSDQDAVLTYKTDTGGAVYDLLPSQPNPIDFDRITITTDTACTIKVRFYQEGADMAPPAQELDALTTAVTASTGGLSKPGSGGSGLSDVSNGSASGSYTLASANADRAKLWIQRIDSEATEIRIGFLGQTGASQGFKMNENDVMIIENTAEIEFYKSDGSTVEFCLLEEEVS